jgi:gluconate 2-dehydrogenase gamma chain
MKRREFLTITAAGVAGAQQQIPLKFFTAHEALAVEALTERIFPTDESGPGAKEAAVVIYIDRQLAGPYGRDRHRYTKGPFEDAPPELGWQGQATPREIYREALKKFEGVEKLAPAAQDEALRAIENTAFFALLRQHTIEGMFCDPVHGGNKNLAGWRLIGFPGPRMSYSEEIENYHGREFRPKPAGLEQILGRKVKPWEEETG